MKSSGTKSTVSSLFTESLKDDIKFFLVFAIAGVLTSYINVRIPHTPVVIDGRWIFGFLAFAMIQRFWLALCVACILSVSGSHTLPIALCFVSNMLYALPALITIRLAYSKWLSKINKLLVHYFLWLLMVIVIYELFITPTMWGIIGITSGESAFKYIIQGWITQPFLVELLIVGILSAAVISVYKSYIQLARERSELDITLDSIGDGVIVTNTEAIVKKINPEACNIIGIAHDAATGKKLTDFLDIFSSSTGESIENPVKMVLENGKIVGLANSTSVRTLDGRIRQIADSASPIYDHSGTLIGVVMVFRDITEEYLARKEMRKKDVLLQNSQKVGNVGSWEYIFRDKKLIWSDEVYKILGCETTGVSHSYRLFIDTVHPDDREFVKTAFRNSIRKGISNFQIEHRIVHSGEIRHVVLMAQNNRDSDGQMLSVVGMIQDITERKEAEMSSIKTEKMYGSCNNRWSFYRCKQGIL